MAEKKKGPRDLDKRPPSRSANAPDHIRLGKHGVRTTVETRQERMEQANAQATSEEFEEGRSTGAGPNPYKTKPVRSGVKKGDLDKLRKELEEANIPEHRILAHLESARESDAADAEIRTPGETLTDTGQKIRLEPERLAADEKATLPKAGTPHEEATAKSSEDLASHNNPGFNVPEQAKKDLKEATK